MKRASVTGAGGFIGSHVVRELLGEGVEVRALLRPGEPTVNLDGLEVEVVRGDVLDAEAVERFVDGADAVFHLAGIYAIWMPDWGRMYEVNIQGTRNVLWASLRRGVGRVVHTSSIAALGIAPGTVLGDERTPFNQYTLGSHYVLTKYLSQQEALGFARNGLDVVVVNPAFPFGANDREPTPTGQIIVDILRGHNRFYFEGGVNIVDVVDVARGHVRAARAGRRGELYVLGNRNVTMRELSALALRLAGLEGRRLIPLPVPALKAATAALLAWSDRVSRRPPLSTPVEVEYSSNYLYFDPGKAQRELGLTLTPIEDSLRRSIDWFREHGAA